jgi:uncharacterized membrane protein YhaH (DUF805 family)
MNLLELFGTTQGRVGRGMYWSCIGIWFLIDLVLRGSVSAAAHWSGDEKVVAVFFWVWMVFSVSTYFPLTALLIKRLHDVGHSGVWTVFQHAFLLSLLCMVASAARMSAGPMLFWMLLLLACSVGLLVVLVFTLMAGEDGRNDYGTA